MRILRAWGLWSNPTLAKPLNLGLAGSCSLGSVGRKVAAILRGEADVYGLPLGRLRCRLILLLPPGPCGDVCSVPEHGEAFPRPCG